MYPMVCVCTMCDKQFILSVEEEPKHGVVPMICDECQAELDAMAEQYEDQERAKEEAYYASLAELDANPRYADPFACLGYGFKASEY